MDSPDEHAEDANGFHEEDAARPRQLPADLPKSLDDRQPVRNYGGETEMYDAWQGRVRTSSETCRQLSEGPALILPHRPISILNQSNACSTPRFQSLSRRSKLQ